MVNLSDIQLLHLEKADENDLSYVGSLLTVLTKKNALSTDSALGKGWLSIDHLEESGWCESFCILRSCFVLCC